MVPFPTNYKTAIEWAPSIDKAATNSQSASVDLNVGSFVPENMEGPTFEARELFNDVLKFDEIDLNFQPQDVDDEYPNEDPNQEHVAGPSEERQPVEGPSHSGVPPVQNRQFVSTDYQKAFIPVPSTIQVEPFLDWIFRIKYTRATSNIGFQMYSDEFIREFYGTLPVNGVLPSWTFDPSTAELISRINDYAIWKIKDEGLYSRESLGVVNYVDSKFITEAIESLQKKTERESQSIFNIENMMKSMISHQKSGSKKYDMADVPTVMPVAKPLFEEPPKTSSEVRTREIIIPPF